MQYKDIITELYESPFLNETLYRLTSNNDLKDDLKQELMLILLQQPDKVEKAYREKWLKYLVINIIKKQFWSNTSPFFNKYRKLKSIDPHDIVLHDSPKEDPQVVIDTIFDIVDNDPEITWFQRELFKMYFKLDRYDTHFGELRDIFCDKDLSTYRRMEQLLQKECIKIKKGKSYKSRITIGRTRIGQNIEHVKQVIRKRMDKIN